ncbi:MAG: cytidylate kinase family protein [Ramlibacter sp.]|nr:cytidylate kinase family protein [Ramlibacter sp.]
MPVIAMTQEMGSLAKDVALRLAQASGLAVMRHEVLENVASKMHVPGSLISRLREGKAGLVERLSTDQERVAIYTEQELYALAARGNVVLRGWGASALLRTVPHVVTVRVTRSFDKRVAWVMERLGTDDRSFAESEVQRSDHAHASRMHSLYGVTWGDPVLYDIVLNTERLSVDSCVAVLQQLAARPEFQETAASKALLSDLALSAQVRAVLRDEQPTRELRITIESNSGTVVLGGIVINEQERAAAGRVAAAVPGVVGVDNQLRLMALTRRFASAKT